MAENEQLRSAEAEQERNTENREETEQEEERDLERGRKTRKRPSLLSLSLRSRWHLLAKVENYTTAIPDSVTESVLNSAGLQSTDVQVTRMVSLVAQKFLSDVAYEALQHCKMRGGGKEMKKVSGRDRKFALTSEDLLVALTDQGIRVKKPPFYAN